MSRLKSCAGRQFEASRCAGSQLGRPHSVDKLINIHRRFGVPSQADYNTRFPSMTQPQKKTRRQMLEEFVAAKPNDAFARYGLAMECANSGDASAADQQFKMLLGAH